MVGRGISGFLTSTPVSKKTFDYLSFTKQKVLFNANGYPEPEMLTVKKRNKTEKINIFKLVEGSDAQVKQ